MKDKIVFFGAGPYILPVLEVLNRDFYLVLVVTTETNQNSVTLSFCRENNINVLVTNKLDLDSFRKLRDHKTQIAVLASFGLIIPEDVLNLYPLGIINVHPSLLPKYRGATPVSGAILAGETITGVSIIKLDRELDHGPLLGQVETEIKEEDTADSLYKSLFEKGAQMLGDILPRYIKGELNTFEQNHSEATFTDRLTRESGFIDLNNQQSIINNKLQLMIRAYYPWPGVWFRAPDIANQEKQSQLSGKIIKLLPDSRIQVEGKNPMSIKDFANGYSEGKALLDLLNLHAE